MKYFYCEHCGNLVEMIQESGVALECCGQQMIELIPGTSDGAMEKHVPVIWVEDNQVMVDVGAIEHPMLETHRIEWIVIETNKGSHKRNLQVTDKPRAFFLLNEGEEVIAAYEYCNLHGLWKAEM